MGRGARNEERGVKTKTLFRALLFPSPRLNSSTGIFLNSSPYLRPESRAPLLLIFRYTLEREFEILFYNRYSRADMKRCALSICPICL